MNNHAQHLYCQLQALFTNPHHHNSFNTLLALFLKADGKPQPHHATSKSASALSRFLNTYPWNTRKLIRTTRRTLINNLLQHYQTRRARRPWIRAIIDLTTLEKRGFFHDLGLVRKFGTSYGLHVVVLYLVVGPWRVPWNFRIYRGQGHPTPSRLALRLLRSLPEVLKESFRIIVLADAGFDNQGFLHGVHRLGFNVVVSVRKDRLQQDGTPLREAKSGSLVRLKGVDFPVTVAKYVIKRADGEREKRLVVASYVTHKRMVTRWGARRWAIEALFKTLKGRFGWDRFGQGTRRGVMRFLVLGLLAFVLTQFGVWQERSWPDWGEAALRTRRLLVPEVVQMELLWELERLKPFLLLDRAVSLT